MSNLGVSGSESIGIPDQCICWPFLGDIDLKSSCSQPWRTCLKGFVCQKRFPRLNHPVFGLFYRFFNGKRPRIRKNRPTSKGRAGPSSGSGSVRESLTFPESSKSTPFFPQASENWDPKICLERLWYHISPPITNYPDPPSHSPS